jgi:hypothetical protein
MVRWWLLAVLLLLPTAAQAALVHRFTDYHHAASGTSNTIAVDAKEQDNDYLQLSLCLQSDSVSGISCTGGWTAADYTKQINGLTLIHFHKTASGESGTYSCTWMTSAVSDLILSSTYETSGTVPTFDKAGTPASVASGAGITAPSIGTMAQSGELVYSDFCTNSVSGNTPTDSSIWPWPFGDPVTYNWTLPIGLAYVGSSATTLPQRSVAVGSGGMAWIAGTSAVKGVSGAGVIVGTEIPRDNNSSATSVALTPSGFEHSGDWEFAYIAQDQAVGGAVTPPVDVSSTDNLSGTTAFTSTKVVAGDLMAVWFGSTGTNSAPASCGSNAWSSVVSCNDSAGFNVGLWVKTAEGCDTGHTSTFSTTGAFPALMFINFHSATAQTLATDGSACVSNGNASSVTTPTVTTATANDQVINIAEQSTGTTVMAPGAPFVTTASPGTNLQGGYVFQAVTGVSTGQTFTSNSGAHPWSLLTVAVKGSGAGSPWASVLSVTDSTSNSRSDLYAHKNAASDLATWTFTFPAAGQSSGSIITVGNLNSTTPVVESATSSIPGIGVSGLFYPPQITPTTADELCFFGMGKGIGGGSSNGISWPSTLAPTILRSWNGFIGGKAGNIISTAYAGVDQCETNQAAVIDNGGFAETAFTLALKAATAPTHPTAIERVDQEYIIGVGALPGVAGGYEQILE